MTITLELTPQQEARLRKRAARQGKAPADVLAALVETLPEEAQQDAAGADDPDAENAALIALLQQWRQENDQQTEAERDESEAQWQAFREGMNTARIENGQEPVY